MPLTNWNTDKIIIGVNSIDNKHNEILDIMENIKVAIIDRKSEDELNHLCNQLVITSRLHFDEEERLMLKYFYPDTEAHIGQHMAYITIIATLLQNLKDKQFSYSIETVKYLANWFVEHIKDADSRYGLYIHHKSA